MIHPVGRLVWFIQWPVSTMNAPDINEYPDSGLLWAPENSVQLAYSRKDSTR